MKPSIYDPEASTLILLKTCVAHPELATFAGVHVDYARKWLDQHAKRGAPSLKYDSQEIQDKALAMAGSGLSAARVAKSLGIATSTVGYWWRRANGAA